MSLARVVEAFGLPPRARVDRRMPKTLLLEHGAPTSTDKRQIQDGIEAIVWVAALKPATVGVPAFRDDVREYLEVAVMTVAFRTAAKVVRLTELVHRAVPYPVLLVSDADEGVAVSLAHKRWSLGQAGDRGGRRRRGGASPLTPARAAFSRRRHEGCSSSGAISSELHRLIDGVKRTQNGSRWREGAT